MNVLLDRILRLKAPGKSRSSYLDETAEVVNPVKQMLRIKYSGHPVQIAAKVRRTGGTCLVFLHGIGCTMESFDGAFLAKELQGYSICTFDFPGHGESSGLSGSDYSLQMYADIADQVIRRLSFDRLCIVGHSMGGAVAIIATQGRSDIECLVNADGNLVAQDCGLVSRDIAAQSSAAFTHQGYEQFVAALQSSSRTDLRTWGQWCTKATPEALHQAARSLVEWSDSGKLFELFNALPHKAYLYGAQDDKGYLLNQINDATISAVPGAGHFMMLDNPDFFYRLLSETLAVSAPECMEHVSVNY